MSTCTHETAQREVCGECLDASVSELRALKADLREMETLRQRVDRARLRAEVLQTEKAEAEKPGPTAYYLHFGLSVTAIFFSWFLAATTAHRVAWVIVAWYSNSAAQETVFVASPKGNVHGAQGTRKNA